MEEQTKFCKFCGEKIHIDAVICTKCGRQVEKMGSEQQQLVINNVANSAASSSASASAASGRNGAGKLVNKWVAFTLCLFLGFLGGHKFYEGKMGTGFLYMCTFGLFFIGWIIDLLNILGKPDPYEVI